MTLRKLSDEEKQKISDLDMSKVFQELKDSEEVDVKSITIDALYKDNNLLGVASDLEGINSDVVVQILLNILVSEAREYTDIESFIKTIISIWGTYDETEGNS